MAKYAALLDACVLVPVSLADTLLRLAEVGLFRPLWSESIIAEAHAAIRLVHPGIDERAIARRLTAMNAYFDDANVDFWEPFLNVIDLPDPNDAHVLAAAIRGRADVIVTANVKDFPSQEVSRFGIGVESPDSFLINQLDLNPQAVMASIQRQATSMKDPSVSVVELLDHLRRSHAPGFAALASSHLWRLS